MNTDYNKSESIVVLGYKIIRGENVVAFWFCRNVWIDKHTSRKSDRESQYWSEQQPMLSSQPFPSKIKENTSGLLSFPSNLLAAFFLKKSVMVC